MLNPNEIIKLGTFIHTLIAMKAYCEGNLNGKTDDINVELPFKDVHDDIAQETKEILQKHIQYATDKGFYEGSLSIIEEVIRLAMELQEELS